MRQDPAIMEFVAEARSLCNRFDSGLLLAGDFLSLLHQAETTMRTKQLQRPSGTFNATRLHTFNHSRVSPDSASSTVVAGFSNMQVPKLVGAKDPVRCGEKAAYLMEQAAEVCQG